MRHRAQLAREDDRDLERLSRTCPQRLYRENDRAFSGRLEASGAIAEAVVFSLLPSAANRQMLQAVSSLLDWTLGSAAEQVERAFELGRDEGSVTSAGVPQGQASRDFLPHALRRSIDESRERLTNGLLEMRRSLAREAKSLFAAFAAVCRDEMGLDPEIVLVAHFAPFLEQLALEELEDVEVEPEMVRERERTLRRAWEEMAGGTGGSDAAEALK